MEGRVVIKVSEVDFKKVFKRVPETQEEFSNFLGLVKKGLYAQLDWDMIYSCVREHIIEDEVE